MDYTEIRKKLGEGWGLHRSKDNAAAVKVFESLVSKLEGGKDSADLAHLVDALYGLGLAQRATGDKAGAIKSFESALELAKQGFAKNAKEGFNNIKTSEDDRFLMLQSMLNQRIAETT